jgi:methenyltetrahydromethanopterin cyclohydrolase
MPKRSRKQSSDINRIATDIVRLATNETSIPVIPTIKNPAAVALGRLGGLKGGPARAKHLTPKKRRQIAKKAAKARWGK